MIDFRREKVAAMRLQGFTMREITARLPDEHFVDPVTKLVIPCINLDTQKPWGRQTICNDIAHMRKAWREQAAKNYDEHQVEQLARIDEVWAAAWRTRELTVVLAALKQRASLLGLDKQLAPPAMDFENEEIKADLRKLTNEQLDALATIGQIRESIIETSLVSASGQG